MIFKMYNPSVNYLKKSQELVRTSKTKIVIGTKIYDGAYYIKNYPKFSHSNETMLGGFPSKTVEFSLYNRNKEEIDVLNNDIHIFKGIVLDDNTIEWIPQGVFNTSSENVNTSDSGYEISIKAQDKSLNTEIRRIDNLIYPCTDLEYIKDVLKQCGLELESEDFPFFDHVMKSQPNYNENTTFCRELISRFAEERGCIAIMSRTGKVLIKYPVKTNFKIYNYQYKKMPSCESQFGGIDAISLGKENMNDDIVYPSKEVLPVPKFLWSINDNPYLDLVRKDMLIEVYNTIKGMEIIPFSLEECLDNYCLDLNDIIDIQLKDGKWISTTILSYSTNNRLKCNIAASVQNKKLVNYKLAGSIKKEFNQVKIDVDHVNKEILMLAEKVEQSGIPRYEDAPTNPKEEDIYLNTKDNIIYIYKDGKWNATSIDPSTLENYWTKDETKSQIQMKSEEINSSVVKNNESLINVQKELSELKQTSNQLELNISKIGGINLIENSSWQNKFDKWLETKEKILIVGDTFPSHGESLFWYNTKEQQLTFINFTMIATVGMHSLNFNQTTTEFIPTKIELTKEQVYELFDKNYISSVVETKDTNSNYLLNLITNSYSLPSFESRNIDWSIVHEPFNVKDKKNLTLSVKLNGYINYGSVQILVHYLDGNYKEYSEETSLENLKSHILKTDTYTLNELTADFKKNEFELNLENIEFEQITVEFKINNQQVNQNWFFNSVSDYRTLEENEFVYFNNDKNVYKSVFKDVEITYIESETEPVDKKEEIFWYSLIEQKMKRYVYKEKHESGSFKGYELVLEDTDITKEDIQKGYKIRIYDRLAVTGKTTSDLIDDYGSKYLPYELTCNISECMLSDQKAEWQPASGENFWGRNFKFSQDGISITNTENGYKRNIDADEDIAKKDRKSVV